MNNETTNNKEVKKNSFSTSETIILVALSLVIGLLIGFLYNKKSLGIIRTNTNDEYLNEFISNYDYILENYYKEVDKEDLINSAIAGMMNGLDDPYSIYIDENSSNTFSITLNGSYEGIGVQIFKDSETGYMVIVGVLKNSPAEKSGLKPGDIIIKLDGDDISTLSSTDFVSLIKKGNKNEYTLTVLRENSELEITLSKEIIDIPSVVSETYDIDNKKVGYIYIGIFANNTLKQFKEQLSKIEQEKIDYLIIDVRGNSGGHLTAVDGILDIFLTKKQIMYKFEQSNSITPIYGKGTETKKYKIVLLGDKNSASASEVLIGGLKENLNSTFIGKKTYGKGTVQELITLSNGTQYKITTKKWLTPKGNWINETNGISPDIEVELDQTYYETYDIEDDTQLQAAFEYIKKSK